LPGNRRGRLQSETINWIQVQHNAAAGDTQNPFAIESNERYTHLRLKIYPDGGVARLRVYGKWFRMGPAEAIGGQVDLAAVENGGLVLRAAICFSAIVTFGYAGPRRNMSDGWKQSARRGPRTIGRLLTWNPDRCDVWKSIPPSREIFRRVARWKATSSVGLPVRQFDGFVRRLEKYFAAHEVAGSHSASLFGKRNPMRRCLAFALQHFSDAA